MTTDTDNWRNAQPKLDRNRAIIEQAGADFARGKKTNPYEVNSEDWDIYELGWFGAEAWAVHSLRR